MKHFLALLLLTSCTQTSKPLTYTGFHKTLYSQLSNPGSITGITGSVSLFLYENNFSETLFSIGTTGLSDCNINGEVYNTYADIYAAHPTFQLVQHIILKQPTIGENTLQVDYTYPGGVPNQGCIVTIVDTGAASGYSQVQNLDNLTVQTSGLPSRLTILDHGDEFCFGQSVGCELAGTNDTVFVNAFEMPYSGILVSLQGDISSSALIGSPAYSAPPSGAWSVTHAWYTIPGGCGSIRIGMYAALDIPNTAIPLYYAFNFGHGVESLQSSISQPIGLQLNYGDCVFSTTSMSGTGAVDAEDQVEYVVKPL